MRKIYIKPTTTFEDIRGIQLLSDSETLSGTLDDKLIIDFGGVDDDGNLDPSANRNNSWDDGSWDKL